MIEFFGSGLGQKYICGQSGYGTLKVTVSEKWTDGINSCFTWCFFKTKLSIQ